MSPAPLPLRAPRRSPLARSARAGRFFAAVLVLAPAATAQVASLPNVTLRPAAVLNLWPGPAPGETGTLGPEHVLPDRPRPFDQITDVSVPTLAVFLPAAAQRTGTGVLVIPGGGLDRLALETEGFEIAEWLNAHGLAAFVLKYRVPARSRDQRWKAGLQDAQRAMGLIRARAAAWQIDPDSLGTIGFSAGAELNVMLSVYHAEPRQYPRLDAADDLSSRPDFNLALYGGGFANPATNTLREDIATRLDSSTPPMWIAHAFDDAALSSLILMNALKRANVPSELHIFGAGAHGFAVRDSGLPIGPWRDLCLNWLRWQGFLDTPAVRAYARDLAQAQAAAAPAFPRFPAAAGADLAPAYAAQHRLVRRTLAAGGAVAGYLGAFTTAATQKTLALTQPAHGVLFRAGRLDATATPRVIPLDPRRPLVVTTGIGYVIATDIGTKLRVPRQALTTLEALVPVVAFPLHLPPLLGGTLTAADAVAANLGSARYLVGAPVDPKMIPDLDALPVSLRRDDRPLHAAAGADALGGQAQNLMTLINQIVDAGHVLHRGDIIVGGALGAAQPGAPGGYTANFGPLGQLEFRLE